VREPGSLPRGAPWWESSEEFTVAAKKGPFMPEAESESIGDPLEPQDSDGELGFDDEGAETLDIQPSERNLLTQPYDVSVRQLTSDVASGRIVLVDIPYQRQYVWDRKKASRLIESLLLNVPIPVCYFAESDEGTWEVVDGLQRTQSIVRFLNGEFRLSGLTVLPELNRKTFSQLPKRDQLRIEGRTIRFVVVTNESHPDIKFDVFERLNTGSVKLTAQELRNSIYRGRFNEELKSLAGDPALRAALGRDRDNRMQDEELVLRFLALRADLAGYKPSFSQFLNEFMRAHRSTSISDDERDLFRETLATVADVLGGDAFRALREGRASSNVNRALFDAVTLAYAFADRSSASMHAGAAREAHARLLNDAAFQLLISGATADRTKVHGRVKAYANALAAAGVPMALPSGLEGD